jgi:regulator of ribosome biosynthesis
LFFYLFLYLDPNEDQFAKRSAAKKERVAKNEFQRLKNIQRSNKINGK